MIVKNISGLEKQFVFSNQVSHVLANNASLTLEDDHLIFVDCLKLASQGLLEITKGPAFAASEQSVDQPASIEVVVTANPADTETVTINGVIFEFDSGGGVTVGNVTVTIGGSSGATLDALAAAVLAHAAFVGYQNLGASDHEATGAVLGIALPDGVAVGDVTVAETMGTGTIATRSAVEGGSFVQLLVNQVVSTIPDDMIFFTHLATILHVEVVVRTTAGVIKAWDGATNWDGGVIALDNSGATDVAATDVIFIRVTGTI